MAEQPKHQAPSDRGGRAQREDRLAAALRANLARRKAQARQRREAPAAEAADEKAAKPRR